MQIEQLGFISIIKNRIIKNFIINLRRYASPLASNRTGGSTRLGR